MMRLSLEALKLCKNNAGFGHKRDMPNMPNRMPFSHQELQISIVFQNCHFYGNVRYIGVHRIQKNVDGQLLLYHICEDRKCICEMVKKHRLSAINPKTCRKSIFWDRLRLDSKLITIYNCPRTICGNLDQVKVAQ